MQEIKIDKDLNKLSKINLFEKHFNESKELLLKSDLRIFKRKPKEINKIPI